MINNAGDEAALQLQDLLMGTENVEDFLGRLAEFSAATLSHAAGAEIECGVTLQRRRKTMTVAGSSPRAVALDRNFVEIDTPIFGAIVLVGTHHATMAYARSGKGVVCLGGNQGDQITFSNYVSNLRYYVPLAYHEFAKKEIERGNSLATHTATELNKAFGIVIVSKKGNAVR